MKSHHRSLIVVVAFVVAVVVASCGGPASSNGPADSASSVAPVSPAAIASVAPSPSSPAVTMKDVLFKLADSDLAFSGKVTGSVTSGGTTLPVTGTLDLAAGDSHSLMTIETPGGSQVNEQIAVDGKTWTRSGIAGPWFEKPTSSSGRDLGRTLTKIGNVTDEGIVQRDGRPVHHFGTVEGAVPASALGLDGPGVSGFGGKFDLYADDSAELVGIGMSAEWKQAGAGGAPVDSSMTLDFALSKARPVIEAPQDVWVRFPSTRWNYSIGHPAGVNAIEGSKATDPDVFAASADEFYVVLKEEQPRGVKLTDYVKAYVDATNHQLKTKPESRQDITIDGRPGTLLTYHIKLAGKVRFNLVAITLDGRDGYTISLVGNKGQEQGVSEFLPTLLSTFAIGR